MQVPDGTAELVLDAILETPGPQAPAPGHEYRLSVSRYRVLKVLKGTYPRRFVLVAHDGADMSSAAFQPGTRKELELTSRFPVHASLMYPVNSGGRGEPVYFCIRARTLAAATGKD